MSPKTKTSASTANANDVLPAFYFHFFALFEPVLTIAGAIYAIAQPQLYHEELIPRVVALKPTAIHPASIMAVRQLGSCFFLLALLGSLFFRHLAVALRAEPDLLEPLVSTYLQCLALADLTHIGFTLYDIGLYAALRPFTHYNSLVFGNVVITTGLFVVRMGWFLGIGRGSTRKGVKVK